MKAMIHTNKLIHESSPYLKQHAHNPVEWYPWGKEALTKAAEEDKLLLISIGYAACHWCHVMEKESFENEEIATIMNRNFICIKVDREERPDIDQIYMEAVQMMTGSGGWPLNCFALPDGKPVYGGTYFRPSQWKELLKGLAESYRTDKQKFENFAGELIYEIKKADQVDKKQIDREYKPELAKEIIDPWKVIFDTVHGGSKRAPKFPMPNAYLYLLEYYYYTKDTEILDHVCLSLDKMAMGGIYDHAGGGFARYSVDHLWKVPHFEKMLYDNAQLIGLYAKAFQLTKKELYKDVVYQTIEFVQRELGSSNGAFFSSLDADSEGVEGKYYVWKKEELEEILKKEAELYCDFYHVTHEGNWEEQTNILYRSDNLKDIIIKYNLPEPALRAKMVHLNQKVQQEREKRVKPGLDDKILASWNALMLKGLVDAYRAFGEDLFLEMAIKNAEFIQANLLNKDGSIWRNFHGGTSRIKGFLDDYAFTADAFIALYQATFDEKWLSLAKDLCNFAIQHFLDPSSGMLYYTSNLDEKLITRKKEIHDNVIPSSNSVMANILFNLGTLYYKDQYKDMALQMLGNIKENIKSGGMYYSNWASLLNKLIWPIFEVVVTGPASLEFRGKFDREYLPFIFFAGSVKDSNLPILENRLNDIKTTIYVCRNKVCLLPVGTVEEALTLIEKEAG
jgi:uncharacterized protein